MGNTAVLYNRNKMDTFSDFRGTRRDEQHLKRNNLKYVKHHNIYFVATSEVKWSEENRMFGIWFY